jgi:hypothetical protein
MNKDETSMQEVVALLTKTKGYTDSNTESARQQILVKILQEYGESKLADAVCETLTRLVLTTDSPLEVADCIVAWSIAHNDHIPSIFNGVKKIDFTSTQAQKNAQGLALGCFEAVVLSGLGRSIYNKGALMRYLAYILGSNIWKNPRCTYSPCITGRMTNAIKKLFEAVWIDTNSDMFKELSGLFSSEAIIIEEPEPEKIVFSAVPKTLHDALINEICSNFYLAAFPFQRLKILQGFFQDKNLLGKK